MYVHIKSLTERMDFSWSFPNFGEQLKQVILQNCEFPFYDLINFIWHQSSSLTATMKISWPFLINLAYEMHIQHTYTDHEFLSFEISPALYVWYMYWSVAVSINLIRWLLTFINRMTKINTSHKITSKQSARKVKCFIFIQVAVLTSLPWTRELGALLIIKIFES